MTNITFRQAQEDDLPVIISMLADDDLGSTREDASLPVNQKYRAAFEAIDKDQNQYLAVVEQANEIIGCLQLTFIPGLSRLGMWRGQIESVRIASGHRGSGLGRQMFEWAITECRKRGCELVQLTTDKARPDALKFYEKLGFKSSHEGMKLNLD
ncbi:GNAT family N-acetyltransferase [Kiloniella sp.]|uniref:GNAT family N-acetyltransferase n=1 Tax=Kiloniella sp. TaxID=1938587 RepID=UPI003A924453